MRIPCLVYVAATCAGCSAPATQEAVAPEHRLPPGIEAISLVGDTLRPPALDSATRAGHEARLVAALREAQARPHDADALIWVGRRTAYLGRYREAIAVFTRGHAEFPDDARFLRHRGHRHVTVRDLDRAIADLEQAARLVAGRSDEVEPDGLPNARGIPTSTLQSNIWYHLGLARYLKADFPGAASAWSAGLAVSRNNDMLVATSYWLYLALRRAGRLAEAAALLEPIRADMEIIENRSYHRLLLVFTGALASDSTSAGAPGALDIATVGYGLGAWHQLNGRGEDARSWWRRVMAGGNWPAFGFIAAEAELARDLRRP